MSQIEVALVHEDPGVRSRLIRLRVRSKPAITPIRSLCLTHDPNSEAKVFNKNPLLSGINELPREIDKAKLEDIDGDRDKQETFYREIRYRFSGLEAGHDITAFIFTYNNKDKSGRNRQPTSVESEYLCGLLNHPLNDLWVPPIIPDMAGRAYIPYLRDFYREAESYRKVAVAGLIPRVASIEIRQLTEFYARKGLNYFVMDFAGKNPLDLVGIVNPVIKMIDTIERETGSICFLHGINVPLTKAHWSRPVVPAKDILVFGMGFNCFGSNHVKRRLPGEIVDKINSSTNRPFRLFCRRDYAYYRNDTDGLKEMVEEKGPTQISLEAVAGGRTWGRIATLEKLFNVERHGLEANAIRTKLFQEESVANYIQTKSMLPGPYLKKVFDMKRQTSLN